MNIHLRIWTSVTFIHLFSQWWMVEGIWKVSSRENSNSTIDKLRFCFWEFRLKYHQKYCVDIGLGLFANDNKKNRKQKKKRKNNCFLQHFFFLLWNQINLLVKKHFEASFRFVITKKSWRKSFIVDASLPLTMGGSLPRHGKNEYAELFVYSQISFNFVFFFILSKAWICWMKNTEREDISTTMTMKR